MFTTLKRLPLALHALVGAIERASGLLSGYLTVVEENEPLRDRLEALELSKAKWEALMEAEFLKADSKFKAARASEERERKLKGNNGGASESDTEGLEEIRAAYEAAGFVQASNALAGPGQEMPALYEDLGVVPQRKQLAIRRKFGA